jgi:hypothetical protein
MKTPISMSPLLYIVNITVDRDREEAWNEYYDSFKLPACLACSGFIGGARYKLAAPDELDPTKVNYLTIYQLESRDALFTDELNALRTWGDFAGSVEAENGIYPRSEYNVGH